MQENTGDLQELMRRVDEVQGQMAETISRIQKIYPGSVGNHSSIQQNVGGIANWLSVTLCFGMLTACLAAVSVASAWSIHEFTRRDAQIMDLYQRDQAKQSYLNAIYTQAPYLKPKEK